MATLLLRFAAPLQAWGTESKYDIRKTDREPSKSGIVGFLAAALGRKRDESVEDLNTLRIGVRVDQEGEIIQDFHMVHKDEKTSYLTRRYYLSDAIFVVGLESQDSIMLQQLETAIKNPVFPLFLGRRSCPPCGPIVLGIRESKLEMALDTEPWQVPQWRRNKKKKEPLLRKIIESKEGGAVRKDLAISFSPYDREYGYRSVRESVCCPPIKETKHDPMKELSITPD